MTKPRRVATPNFMSTLSPGKPVGVVRLDLRACASVPGSLAAASKTEDKQPQDAFSIPGEIVAHAHFICMSVSGRMSTARTCSQHCQPPGHRRGREQLIRRRLCVHIHKLCEQTLERIETALKGSVDMMLLNPS